MTNITFLLHAAGLTLSLSLYALVFGLILAFCFAAGESIGYSPIRRLVTLLITLLRGLPEILVVLSIFYGLSMLYIVFVDGFVLDLYFITLPIKLTVSDPNNNISPFCCGVIALSLLYASYASQTIRGAINAIPSGQWEAGYALGLSKAIIFRRLIIPQLWQHALPGLGNQWLVLLKDTALISLIGVNDLMHQSGSIALSTNAPFTWYGITALIYLFISLVSQSLLKLIEQRTTHFTRGHR